MKLYLCSRPERKQPSLGRIAREFSCTRFHSLGCFEAMKHQRLYATKRAVGVDTREVFVV